MIGFLVFTFEQLTQVIVPGHALSLCFGISALASAPTGLMLDFVEALYRHSANATDEFGNITREFEDIARDAYVDSGFTMVFS